MPSLLSTVLRFEWAGISLLVGAALSVIIGPGAIGRAADQAPRFPLPSDSEAWRKLPAAVKGNGQPLPSWARIMSSDLPRTTGALLELDFVHRTKSPVRPDLRAAMRWVAARANRCAYAEAYAAADARRAGLDAARLQSLGAAFEGWPAADRAALEFARKMTVASETVTDAEFAQLARSFGDRQAAAMVLLLAYANFQDRLLLCLDAPLEPEGPLAPAEIDFEQSALIVSGSPSTANKELPAPTGKDEVEDDAEWARTSYASLQEALEAQRRRPTRLRIPDWDEFSAKVPVGLFKGPTGIVWCRVALGYAPELAVPFEVLLRTSAAEGAPNWDRVFGGSLFWVTTRAVKCPYCMGHVEMNWEVAGLNKDEIAARSRVLAGEDWSSFPPAEQHAFAFARKLTPAPWSISDQEIARLRRELGPVRALLVIYNASRYHYMTRISNGFQLTLERDNVFFDFYDVKPGAK